MDSIGSPSQNTDESHTPVAEGTSPAAAAAVTDPQSATESRPDIARDELKVARLYAPRKRPIRRWFARLVLRLGGWTVETPPPDLSKMVVIAAPHTYWWDGFWMVAFGWAFGLKLSWLVKSPSTRGIMGWLVRKVGGVPVDRSSPQGLVQQLVREFREQDELILVIPPEGTRAKREFWKSGFYYIAHKSNVPIALSYLDYGRTAVGIGPCFHLTGDIPADMDRVREFYARMRGKVPENFTEPRLREELEYTPDSRTEPNE